MMQQERGQGHEVLFGVRISFRARIIRYARILTVYARLPEVYVRILIVF